MVILDSRFHGNDKKIIDGDTGFPFFMGMTEWQGLPIIGKIESTSVIDKIKTLDYRFHGNDKVKIVDSRFHGNDRMVDSRFHGNDKMEGLQMEGLDSRFHGNDRMRNFPMIDKIESTLVIDKIKIMDSRFHGNDRMVGIKNGKTGFPFFTGMTKNTVIPTEVGINITDKKTGFQFSRG